MGESKNGYTQFLQSNPNALEKWRHAEYKDISSASKACFLTPLFGTDSYETLPAEVRDRLYFGFIQFVAEAILFFESLLLFASRQHSRADRGSAKKAMGKFVDEELSHSRGFRKFLNAQKSMPWKEQSFLRYGSPFLNKLFVRILRWQPLAVFIPGVKSERFTMNYFWYMKSGFDWPEDDSWYALNQMHAQDEALHVPFGYNHFDAEVSGMNLFQKIEVIAGTLLFIGLLQILFFKGIFRMASQIFVGASLTTRLRVTLKIGQWILRDFPPYQKTRAQGRRYFDRHPFRLSRVFAFTNW